MHSQLVVGSFSLHMFILHLYAPAPLTCSPTHTVSGLLQVGVQELSSCFVEEVTVTRGTALYVIHIADMHSETYSTFLVWNSTQCTEGSQTCTLHPYLQGKKLFVTALWSKLMIVEMHWPRPYMGVCLDGLWMESTITCSQRMWTTRRKWRLLSLTPHTVLCPHESICKFPLKYTHQDINLYC